MDIFEGLSERQREAVETIDDDLEIIACAGAGKTGVVTRRIVNILKSNPGVLPENIVAFTFTKKAAEELKGRINAYGKSVLGDLAYEEYSDMEDEFTFIARRIMKLHEIGIPYSEIAILLRKRKVSGKIAEVLEAYDIPFVVEGVNDLFETKECNAAKGIFDYLNGDIPATELFERWLQIDYPLDKKEVADAMQYLAKVLYFR